MRIEGSMARTTATAFPDRRRLYAGGSRAQSGWIDGDTGPTASSTSAAGLAIAASSQPVMVMVVDPRNGAGLASAMANNPSEPAAELPAVRRGPPTCASTYRSGGDGRGADRPSDPGPGLLESVQAMVPLGNWGGISYPDNAIRGYIDNASDRGGQVVLSGWGCARGVAQSIWVHVYAGGPAGSGQFVTAGLANEASEWAVLQACGVGPKGTAMLNRYAPYPRRRLEGLPTRSLHSPVPRSRN